MPGFRGGGFKFLFVSLWRKVRAILYCPKKKSDLEVERITKWCQIVAAEVVQGWFQCPFLFVVFVAPFCRIVTAQYRVFSVSPEVWNHFSWFAFSLRSDWRSKSMLFTRWWFQTFFLFTPNLGKMIQFDEHIFQMGGWKTTNQYLVFLHPWRLARKHFLTEVWFRSIFLFYMGDGCRFQPLIFQGAAVHFEFPQLLNWGATDDVRELADS